MNDRRLRRGAAVVFMLAVIGLAVWFSPLGRQFDAVALVAWARQQREVWWALPAYFVAYAVLAVLFIPTQALSIAAVIVWGWWRGGLIELFAATISAIFPYFIVRSTLRAPIVARLEKHRVISDVLAREGFLLLVVLRIVPILPYPILNYVAGLSSLRLWQYLLATFLGMIPSIFIFNYFVEALMEGVMQPRQVVMRILIAGVLLAALIIATRLAAPRVRRRIES